VHQSAVACRNRLVALAFASIPLGGCAASSPVEPTPSPTPASASVSLSVSPNPVTATETDDPKTPLRADWVVTITSAGAGGTVNFVNATLRDAETGALPDPTGRLSLDGPDIAAQAGTNRVAAGGSLRVAQGLDYAPPIDSRRGNLLVTVQLTDDLGNVVSRSATVAVN
jgi:hypothetical protein